jgi:hypothetical protein
MTALPDKPLVNEQAVDDPVSGPAALRINARLDPQTAAELAALVKAGGHTVTEVIKNAIHCFYREQSERASQPALELFRAAGLIGCADGPQDLSSRYKDYLGESLVDKHSPQ